LRRQSLNKALKSPAITEEGAVPKHYAQWVGMFVTAIIVLGTDMDVLYAVPFGIAAGALSVFFVSLSEWNEERLVRIPLLRRVRRDRP
jgi:hypothetical protein